MAKPSLYTMRHCGGTSSFLWAATLVRSRMRLARYPRLSRIVFLLALFQMAAPSVAALADAWRVDQRTPYGHVESGSSSSCVAVHAHDCLLCSIATTSSGSAPQPIALAVERVTGRPAPSARDGHWPMPAARAGAPRAPPVIEG